MADTVRRRRARSAVALALLVLACGLTPPEEGATGSTGTTDPPPPPPIDPTVRAVPPPEYVLVYGDEFERVALDTGLWTPDVRWRRHAQNDADAVSVWNGVLTITTFTENGTHHTGFIDTLGKLETTYGYFEARIRFWDSPGSWCAFWLDSWSNGNPLGDPGTAGVEIDVVEHRATNQDGWDSVKDMVALNLNWDRTRTSRKNLQKVLTLPGGAPVQGEWHVYGVLWTEDGYTFYVDDVPLWTVASAVSHRPEYLNLTCEVHDGSWAGSVPDGGYGTLATSTTRMEVDWVRVWQRGQ